jgi:hypothetical protein
VKQSAKFVIGERTIVTPAARDLGDSTEFSYRPAGRGKRMFANETERASRERLTQNLRATGGTTAATGSTGCYC